MWKSMAASFYSRDFPYSALAPFIEEYEKRAEVSEQGNPDPQANRACQQWDSFYERHGSSFFHARGYLLSCFPLLCSLSAEDTVLECGAGNGSNLLCLLQSTPVRVLAADFSSASLRVLGALPACAEAVERGRLRLLLWDLAAPPPAPLPSQPLAILLFFTLSAIPPKEHPAVLRALAAALPVGGHCCFRDYAYGDAAHLRAPATALLSRQLHRRGDGTLVFYFKLEELAQLFESAGFEVLESDIHTVENINRKTGQSMRRAFAHLLAARRPLE